MSSLFSLKGKIALVTGSVQGLGLGIATAFGESGAKVIINSANANQCEMVAAQLLTQKEIDAVPVAFDVSVPQEIRRAVEHIEKNIGPIDILVNNAGIQLAHAFLEYPEEDLNKMIAVNEKAMFIASQEVGRHMKERRHGKIINICSVQSHMTGDKQTTYAATKGAATMITKGMCVELARYNIQVNGIGPGYIETAMTAGMLKDPVSRKWLCEHTPAGRWGQPRDLAGAAVFLASAASDFVNGHVLNVDGGFLAMI